MSFNGVLRTIGTIATVLLVAFAFTPLPASLAARSVVDDRIEAADAIVVLGAYAYPEGRLSDASLRRAIRGITLKRMGLAPLLVFSGTVPDGGSRSEAELRAELAVSLGVEPNAVLTDATGLTTRGEADVMRRRLAPLGVERILLVSDGLHLVRAKPVFESAGFEVYPAAADDFSLLPDGPIARLALMQRLLEEQLARIYYRAAGFYRRSDRR